MNEKERKEMLWVLLTMWAHTMGVLCWLMAVFMICFLAWFRQLPFLSLRRHGTWFMIPITCIAACVALRFKLPLARAHIVAAITVIMLTCAGWMLGK